MSARAASRRAHRRQRTCRGEARPELEETHVPDRVDRVAEAERRGRDKAKVLQDAMQLAVVTLVVAFFSVGAARWVFFIGGFFLMGDFIKKVIEPGLRRRWIEREVSRELHHEVAVHRKRTLGEHARHIEHLAAGVAHEIRNPITAAKSLVQQMGEDPGSRENVGYAEVALEELGRVERSISHLLRFAREEGVRTEPVELREVVRSALDSFGDRIDRDGVALETRLEGPCALEGDPEKLRRVVINLVANALDAMSEAGVSRPALEVECGEDLAATHVWLRVRDHGPGIGAADPDEIWSPFFTSKGEGTGLGLAITKKIVDAHGGTIDAESVPEGGATFVVILPKQQAASSDSEERADEATR